MKNLVLKLTDLMKLVSQDKSNTNHVSVCTNVNESYFSEAKAILTFIVN